MPGGDPLEKMPQLLEVAWVLRLLPQHVTMNLSSENTSFDIRPFADAQDPRLLTHDGLDNMCTTYRLATSLRTAILKAGSFWNLELKQLWEIREAMNRHLNTLESINTAQHRAIYEVEVSPHKHCPPR